MTCVVYCINRTSIASFKSAWVCLLLGLKQRDCRTACFLDQSMVRGTRRNSGMRNALLARRGLVVSAVRGFAPQACLCAQTDPLLRGGEARLEALNFCTSPTSPVLQHLVSEHPSLASLTTISCISQCGTLLQWCKCIRVVDSRVDFCKVYTSQKGMLWPSQAR